MKTSGTDMWLDDQQKKLIDALDESALVSIADKNGDIVYANSALTKISGYTQEELLGKNNRVLKSGKQPESLFVEMWAVLKLGKTWKGEICNQTKQGKYYWVYATITPFLDEVGNIEKIVSIRFDITESKKSQSKILNSSIELERILQTVNDGIFLIKEDKFFIKNSNQNAADWFGYSRKEMINMPATRLLQQSEQKLLNLHYGKVVKNGQDSITSVGKRKDGSLFPIEINSSFYKTPDGRILVCIVRDISDWVKSQELLKQRNEMYRSVIEETPDAVIYTDQEDIITSWNKGASKIFGHLSSGIIGQPMYKIVPNSLLGEHRSNVLQVNTQGYLKAYETVRKDINGKKIPVEVSASKISTANGDIKGISTLIRDISERKKAQKTMQLQRTKLEKANEDLTQFIYIASHDLQEPLLTLNTYSELLLDEYSSTKNKNIKWYLHYISESSLRMRELVQGLVDHARVGGYGELTVVSLTDTVKDVLADLSVKVNSRNAQISVGKLPLLLAHKLEIRLMFQNIITNALKFNKQAIPKIYIRVKKKGDFWQFSIKDNGIGVPESHKTKIFQMFKQANRRGEYEGSGIGLAHCKKIARLHGGTIWVEPNPDGGSIFYFTLKII